MSDVKNAQIVAWFSALILSVVLFVVAHDLLTKESNLEDIPLEAREEPIKSGDKVAEFAEAAVESSEEQSPEPRKQESEGSSSKTASWSYEEEAKNGPDKWSKVSKDFHACGDSRVQSPINITGAKENHHLPHLRFLYQDSPIELSHNGRTIQANVGPGNYIDLGGDRYELKEFRFHNPSEHRLEGIPGTMEVQFVHKNSRGNTAILAILIDEAQPNKGFASIWNNLPQKTGDTENVEHFNPKNVLPTHKDYFTYSGSLTEPPCTENVKWIVMKEPISMSGAQIDAFSAIVKRSSRPIQDLLGRKIEVSTDGGDIAAH